MPLEAGQRLDAYEVLAPVGSGGMGEVYRARDTRLDRLVAIKVLPQHLSQDAELRERFQQEARAISRLSHPHICVLHDVGHVDGLDYLVMELLEGQSLADRVHKGPLSVDEALTWGRQILAALHEAHRHGIVHRDLKPGNVFLTSSGAKLLDFGLARLQGEPSEDAYDVSALPTQQKPLTQRGAILGTFQYMAPEQLESKEIDARTDLFAFGAVLYEMLTGRKAFEGESQASLITAIMSKQPPAPSTLQPLSPPRLDEVVSRCLAKSPDERWQSAGDLRWELGNLGGEKATLETARPARLSWLVAGAATVAAIGFWGWSAGPTPQPALVRSSIVAPPDAMGAFRGGHALSPDGKVLVFVAANAAGRRVLWRRDLDELNAEAIDGTESARNPFWDPTGTHIGFFSDGKLKRIPVSGGAAQTICDVTMTSMIAGSWSHRGIILFSQPGLPIYKVAADGGVPVPATSLDPQISDEHLGPWFLPDAEHFLYKSRRRSGNAAVYVASIDEPETARKLVDVEPNVRRFLYAAPGYLLVPTGESSVYARRFDVESFELGESQYLVSPNVLAPGGSLALSVSENGSLTLLDSESRRNRLVWRDRKGESPRQVGSDAAYWTMGLSPDGRRILANPDEPQGLHLYDATRGIPSRVGVEVVEHDPVFSPDGRSIAFLRVNELIVKELDGDEQEMPAFGAVRLSDWFRDELVVTIRGPGVGENEDLVAFSLTTHETRPLVATNYNEYDGRVSPDGSWLAYVSDESGEANVFLRPFRISGAADRASPAGGFRPVWSQDGKELFYLRPNGTLMAVAVDEEGLGDAEELFRFPQRGSTRGTAFGVADNGQRFLVIERVGDIPPLTLIQNWTALMDEN